MRYSLIPSPDKIFVRSRIVELDTPKFRSVTNREAFVFDGANPIF